LAKGKSARRALICFTAVFVFLGSFAKADVFKPTASATVEEVAAYIERTGTTEVDIRPCSFSFEEVKSLIDKYPKIQWRYRIALYGQDVDSEQGSVDLGAAIVKATEEMHERLPYLPELERLDLYESRLSNAEMKKLYEAFPNITFGMSFPIGRRTVRTDIEAFSTLNTPEGPRRSSAQYEPFRYCFQLKALDLGHNNIKDIGFLADLTQLKVLILADNSISDISPLKNLTNLVYVELFMNEIADISPLANNPHLIDLNLTHNKVKDYTPLLTCPNLERVWIAKNYLSKQSQDELKEAFPNARFEFLGADSTGYGWRAHERYFVIKEMFDTFVYMPFALGAGE